MKSIILSAIGIILCLAYKRGGTTPLSAVCWGLARIKTSSDNSTRNVPEKVKPVLVIKDSTFSGETGCNGFRGKCAFKADSIVFGWPSSTKKYCPEINWMEDALYRKLMHGSAKYVISGDTLTLTARNNNVYTFYKRTGSNSCTGVFSE